MIVLLGRRTAVRVLQRVDFSGLLGDDLLNLQYCQLGKHLRRRQPGFGDQGVQLQGTVRQSGDDGLLYRRQTLRDRAHSVRPYGEIGSTLLLRRPLIRPSVRTGAPSPQGEGFRQTISPAAADRQAPIPDFRPGDTVLHTAFGRGMLLTVTKMGNDAMLEIAFDEKGTKRLLAKTASAHMRKI